MSGYRLLSYLSVVIRIPQKGGAIRGTSWTVEVDDERVDAMRRSAQSSDVIPHSDLQGSRIHSWILIPGVMLVPMTMMMVVVLVLVIGSLGRLMLVTFIIRRGHK